MASVDRSIALDGLGECPVCASGLARQPQSDPQPKLAIGQIHRLRASVFAPLVRFLDLALDVGRGKPGRPGIISDMNAADVFQVHLLATLTNQYGQPSYNSMPDLVKFFVLRIARALSECLQSLFARIHN